MYCIARIHYLTNKKSWLSIFFNRFSSNLLHADTLVLLFIPACCKLLIFRSWFRKYALAFPTYLFPAILAVFLSHPASFILRFDLFCWHESCWLLRKTHEMGFKRTAYIGESLCFPSSAIPYDLLNHLTGRKQLPLTRKNIHVTILSYVIWWLPFDGCPLCILHHD